MELSMLLVLEIITNFSFIVNLIFFVINNLQAFYRGDSAADSSELGLALSSHKVISHEQNCQQNFKSQCHYFNFKIDTTIEEIH